MNSPVRLAAALGIFHHRWGVLALAGTLLASASAAQLQPGTAQTLSVEDVPGGVVQGGARFGQALVWFDHNGDGFDDLAVFREDSNRLEIYNGGPNGLQRASFQSVLGGAVLAACDFDRDGLDDLAVGLPENSSGRGTVAIFRGPYESRGISGEEWNQDDWPGEVREEGDRFGHALAVGDFDENGVCDLAIGAPGQDVGAVVDAGKVHVVFASTTVGVGLGTSFVSVAQEDTGLETSETGDRFGSVLASGNFSVFSEDDLVVGVPQKDCCGANPGTDAGAVLVLTGRFGFPGFFDNLLLDGQNQASSGDHYGAALAVGDFNGDGRDDLAIGEPGGPLGSVFDRRGQLHVLFGSLVGLDENSTETWDQDQPGVPDQQEDLDEFGAALAAGNFNRDQYTDLVIAIPGEDAGEGALQILYGSTGGLTAVGNQFLRQADLGDPSEPGDRFGSVLAVGDVDGDGGDELAVGVPDEDFEPARGSSLNEAGLVHVVSSPGRIRRVRKVALSGEAFGDTGSIVGPGLGSPRANVQGTAAVRANFTAFIEPDVVLDDQKYQGADIANDGSRVVWGRDDQDARFVAAEAGLLVRDGDPAPGLPGQVLDRIFDAAMTAGGTTYFQSEIKPEPMRGAPIVAFLESPTSTAGDLEIFLKDGDFVDGVEVLLTHNNDQFQISDFNRHWILETEILDPVGIGALLVDEVVVVRADDFVPILGAFLLRIIDVAINSAGRYLFGGVDSENRFFLLSDSGSLVLGEGVDVAPGSTLDGFDLRDHFLSGVGISDGGQVGFVWGGVRGDAAFLACSVDALEEARLVLAEGDHLDFDADGVADAEVLSIFGGAGEVGVAQRPTVGGGLIVTTKVRKIGESTERNAVIEILTGGCPMFADGFESGSTSAWQ